MHFIVVPLLGLVSSPLFHAVKEAINNARESKGGEDVKKGKLKSFEKHSRQFMEIKTDSSRDQEVFSPRSRSH